jgi:Ca-activated chloride channel family protein
MTRIFRAAATGLALIAALAALHAQGPAQFKTGVELINVTATISDTGGRFVPGLRKEDFRVYEDDQLQAVTQFSAERVPVSLGIALDTSGSMAGDKIAEARVALDRFLSDLLDPGDEIFLYRFSDYPVLLQGWTTDRALLSGALGHAVPNGGTAMYDTVADAVPLAAQGSRQKKALVLISDGNDTSSNTPLADLQQLIRESEVLVYAIGIDSNSPVDQYTPYKQPPPSRPAPLPGNRPPAPVPLPFPPLRPRGPGFVGISYTPYISSMQTAQPRVTTATDHVNVAALRDLTDDSGGRTEIIRDPRDLNPATANIADELSKQYYLGYTSSGKKDGRWHAIRVEVRGAGYRVRARRGYIAN